MHFPLYEELLLLSESIIVDKKKLSNDISNLDEIHFEYIYTLFLHYCQLHPSNTNALPFDAKIANQEKKRGLQFYIDSLPETLQKMMTVYITQITLM